MKNRGLNSCDGVPFTCYPEERQRGFGSLLLAQTNCFVPAEYLGVFCYFSVNKLSKSLMSFPAGAFSGYSYLLTEIQNHFTSLDILQGQPPFKKSIKDGM